MLGRSQNKTHIGEAPKNLLLTDWHDFKKLKRPDFAEIPLYVLSGTNHFQMVRKDH
jgi:hypothetical protein